MFAINWGIPLTLDHVEDLSLSRAVLIWLPRPE